MATNVGLQLRLIAEGNAALGKIGTDRGVLYKSIPVLTKVKHLYKQFTFQAEYAYGTGMPHWLAKLDHMFEPFHLERLFLGRHKFHHFRLWYRDELSGYIKEILLDTKTRQRSYLNGNRLEELVRGHTQGTQNYTSEIHRVLTAELIQRQLIE
jgi:asparagine synthase (glutamine-hydrolysing)